MKETSDLAVRNGPDLQINKGVELMLRNKTKKEERSKTFQIRFGKMVSLFRRYGRMVGKRARHQNNSVSSRHS